MRILMAGTGSGGEENFERTVRNPVDLDEFSEVLTYYRAPTSHGDARSVRQSMGFQARRKRAVGQKPPTRRPRLRSRQGSRCGGPDAGRLARKAKTRSRETRGSRAGRGGFDKGTLAAALIGQTRAGEKPAQSASSVRPPPLVKSAAPLAQN
jgi:hypothetical protein